MDHFSRLLHYCVLYLENEISNLKKETDNLKKETDNLKKKTEKLKKEINELKNVNIDNNKNQIYKELLEPEHKPAPQNKRGNIPRALRYAVWEKYLGKNNEAKCCCCKNTTISITNFDCGHIKSNKDGGKIHIDNLKPICKTCNSSMGTTNMDEFIKKYGF